MSDKADSVRGDSIQLGSGELAELIRCSGGNYLDVERTTHGCRLIDKASNDWAIERLAELRGITT